MMHLVQVLTLGKPKITSVTRTKSPKRSFVLRHTYKLSSTAQLDQLFSLVDLEFQWEKHYYQVTGKKRQQIQEQVALQNWEDTYTKLMVTLGNSQVYRKKPSQQQNNNTTAKKTQEDTEGLIKKKKGSESNSMPYNRTIKLQWTPDLFRHSGKGLLVVQFSYVRYENGIMVG